LNDEWITKCNIYPIEYYSAIKKNESMSSAGKQMELVIIKLSEETQSLLSRSKIATKK
jgi:hypothetical protein